ncbi:MAG: hypothetical protein OER88_02760 [Planctomycetota bacterium]|nr:hypothetical protein [Planctomycetota bacterium]
MRREHQAPLVVLAVLAVAAGCRDAVSQEPVAKSPAAVRAARRAYDGAPPVIPHQVFSASCTSCHNRDGIEVPGVGFAPNLPHAETVGIGKAARCTQCHVSKKTDAEFQPSTFQGLRQDLRRGKRHHLLAPPVMPHSRFMRENCRACHTGPAAREEIRCTHPERVNCSQCHVQRTTESLFPAAGG